MAWYLMRHGEAGSRREPVAEDRRRPLSSLGQAQAAGLARLLAGEGIERVLSSPLERCTATADPLARALGLPVELDDRLSPYDPEAALAVVLALPPAQSVAVSTHGEVISHVLAALPFDGLQASASPPMEKGSVWVLEPDGTGVGSARYLAPSPGPAR